MIRRARVVGSLCIVAALISTLSGATDEAVKVEVLQPRLDSYKVQSPTVNPGLKLTFDARFTTRGDAPIEVPDRAWTEDVAGISKWGLESQQSDGSWRTVEGGGDLLWKGETVFPKCKLLSPKETLEVKEISGPFVAFKSHLDGTVGHRSYASIVSATSVHAAGREAGGQNRENEPFRPFNTAAVIISFQSPLERTLDCATKSTQLLRKFPLGRNNLHRSRHLDPRARVVDYSDASTVANHPLANTADRVGFVFQNLISISLPPPAHPPTCVRRSTHSGNFLPGPD